MPSHSSSSSFFSFPLGPFSFFSFVPSSLTASLRLLLSPLLSLVSSVASIAFSTLLVLFGHLYGNRKDQATFARSLELYAPMADAQPDPYQIRPIRATVAHQQISGHRFGWFREELYHIPLETGFLPMCRKRASRHRRKTLGALLLIHGFAQNRHCWDLEGRSLANYLAEAGYDVFFMDLRGSRESRKLGARAPAGIHEFIEIDVRQALKVVRMVSPHKKVYLVGHSMGGAISCASAGRYKDQVGGVVHIAGLYGFNPAQHPLWGYMLEVDKLVRKYLTFIPKDFLLPTREIGQAIRLLRLIMNSPLGAIIPVSIFVAGNIEMNLLTDYLYKTFEPASIGVLQGITDVAHGHPFCQGAEVDYFKQFEALQLPLLVICADKDDLVRHEDSLMCFQNSSSKDKAKLVYVSEASETTAYGHLDIIIGKNAVTNVWEKIRIWLDQRRKLGLQLSEEDNSSEQEDTGYHLPDFTASDLLLPSAQDLDELAEESSSQEGL